MPTTGGIDVGGIDVISSRASIPDKFVLTIAIVTKEKAGQVEQGAQHDR